MLLIINDLEFEKKKWAVSGVSYETCLFEIVEIGSSRLLDL